MKYKFILLSVVIFSSLSVSAQKFKDVFPQIITADEDKSFEILTAYLANNLDHPNTNLRLALIYVHRYKETDVLKEYEKALALAEQAKSKLLKAKLLVTEKEFKKHSDYYLSVIEPGNIPTFNDITNLITNESKAVEDFLSYTPLIYRSFTKSVESYDQAVKTFANIVGKYASLKELYLLYDEDLENQLAFLKHKYDSTIVFFDNFLQRRAEYKINAVQQTYSQHPINIYRMDGLVTQINFLQPTIKLWNYSSWVDSVNTVIKTSIKSLRTDLVANETKLTKAVSAINASANPENMEVVYADKALIFNLMKYDYKNAIVPVINYQEFDQQFLKDQKRQVYFDTANITIDRKLAYYNDMMYKAKQGDSIITEFENRYSPQQLARHKAFINSAFGGAEKMKAYMMRQKEMDNEIYLKQIANIKQGILNIKPVDSLGGIVRFKKIKIPAYIVKDTLTPPINQIKTQYLLKSADESIYVAGRQITSTKSDNYKIGLAKLSADLKPLWVKNIDIEIDSAGVDANNWLGDIKLTSEGVALVVRSTALSGDTVINTLLHITDAGEIKFAQRLTTNIYPRALTFVEASGMFVITFMGDKEIMDVNSSTQMEVMAVNGLGEEIWQYTNSFSGDYQQIITTQNNILIAGNFTRIKNKAGRTCNVSNGSNAYVTALSYTGSLQDIKCLASDTPYRINKVYKVSDKNINLLGTKGEHVIINSRLENIYSSIVFK